jgi:trk system potassium uptake protein
VLIVRPDWHDLRLIAFYVGRVVFGVGLLMLVPAVLALLLREWNAASSFAIGAGLAITIGRAAEIRLHSRDPLGWSHGMATVGFAWLVAPVLATVPLYLSGHYGGWIDAYFDGMSGLTATGQTLVQDVDHMAISVNVWRHLMHFAGGQGIIIVVLSLLAGGGGSQVGTMYFGEGRGDRIVPNVLHTARFIFTVAFVYAAIGITALWVIGMLIGLSVGRSLFHAVTLFATAFDTGGFAPMSASAAYYHAWSYEIVLILLMLAGAFSFAIHHRLWAGYRNELYRNTEVRTFALVLLGLAAVTTVGLITSGAMDGAETVFRKGFLTVISAQTTTGLVFENPRLFVSDWGVLAPAALVTGMAIGGMASSTAGGIKAMRLGLAAKGLWKDVRRVLMPESALVVQTYHAGRRRILHDEQIRGAVVILLLYLVAFLGGAMVMLTYGRWDLTEALFDSTAAASNGGMSVGVMTPEAPTPMKVVAVLQMWFGRLEFMSAFALIGYLLAIARGRT